jgi:hypothetical protein
MNFTLQNPNVNLGVLIFEFERRLGKYNTKIDNIYICRCILEEIDFELTTKMMTKIRRR